MLFITSLSLRAYPWSTYTAAIPSSFARPVSVRRYIAPFAIFSPFTFFSRSVLLSLLRPSLPPPRFVSSLSICYYLSLFFPPPSPGLSILGQISRLARWQLQLSGAIFHPFRNTLDKNYHWTIFVFQLALCTGPFSLAYCWTHAGNLTE